jgi:D-sedoheptulose 7-phosphate isomerase
MRDDRVKRERIRQSLEEAGDLFRKTAASCDGVISEAAGLVVDTLRHGGKVLLCGNGGSAADAQHFATEMTVKMSKVRSPMAAIALTTNSSLLTAQANDLGFETVFARQIESLGRPGDLLIAISTGGLSPNILSGARAARAAGLKVIGLTGRGGGRLAPMCDIAVVVPSDDVQRIQEAHIAVCHLICEFAESSLFGGQNNSNTTSPSGRGQGRPST